MNLFVKNNNHLARVILTSLIIPLFLFSSDYLIDKNQSKYKEILFKQEIKGEVEYTYFNKTGQYLKLVGKSQIKIQSCINKEGDLFSEIAEPGDVIKKEKNSFQLNLEKNNKVLYFEIC